MIHPDPDGTCTIPFHGVWLPGIYADRRAANYAFRFTDAELKAIWVPKTEGGEDPPVITFEELQEFRRKLKGAMS